MLGDKTSLNKLKKSEIMLSTFSNQNGMKLKMNDEKIWKIHKYVEIKQHTPEQPVGQRRSKGKFEKS